MRIPSERPLIEFLDSFPQPLAAPLACLPIRKHKLSAGKVFIRRQELAERDPNLSVYVVPQSHSYATPYLNSQSMSENTTQQMASVTQPHDICCSQPSFANTNPIPFEVA
ncbi:hypothetical protein CDAR_501391 [Caerostris darwini]|uniref:Uncharacterized protein n=1 Tax=Caerostris darwini TaxID=1538125 RepID=A0AAV4R3I2_9ARAC|nr:hypothetical protein CDAR_501391 [Caerostris darwini]